MKSPSGSWNSSSAFSKNAVASVSKMFHKSLFQTSNSPQRLPVTWDFPCAHVLQRGLLPLTLHIHADALHLRGSAPACWPRMCCCVLGWTPRAENRLLLTAGEAGASLMAACTCADSITYKVLLLFHLIVLKCLEEAVMRCSHAKMAMTSGEGGELLQLSSEHSVQIQPEVFYN